jgi:hypothetical protein
LIHQRHLTPSCTAPGKDVHGELDCTPGIREQPRPKADIRQVKKNIGFFVRLIQFFDTAKAHGWLLTTAWLIALVE